MLLAQDISTALGLLGNMEFELPEPESGCFQTQPVSSALSLSCFEMEARKTATERFGVRTSEFVEHGPFRSNGERLLLRGTHRHEDHAGMQRRSFPMMLSRTDREPLRRWARTSSVSRTPSAVAAGAGVV